MICQVPQPGLLCMHNNNIVQYIDVDTKIYILFSSQYRNTTMDVEYVLSVVYDCECDCECE